MTNRQWLDKQIDECEAKIAKYQPQIKENLIYGGVLQMMWFVMLIAALATDIRAWSYAAMLPGGIAGLYWGRAFTALQRRDSAIMKRNLIEASINIANIIIREGDLNFVETENKELEG